MYEQLTDILGELPQEEYGSWIIDRENDGSPEHPIQMPFVSYSGLVRKLMDAVFTFEKNHPEYGLNRYRDILEQNGIKWGNVSMDAVNVANKDGICVMALLLGAVRTERFCDGALLGFFQKGSIQRWLERLKEIDGGGTDKRDEIFDLKRLPAILAKPRMLTGIERYRSIMEKLWRVDVSLDERFQKTYENFYTLGRYSKEFRRDYFAYMERCKETVPSFEEALSYFLKYGTLEVSFSSKLVHTLDPEQPIWDKNVTDRHFGYKIPAYGTKDREKKILDRYKRYKRDFLNYVASDDGKAVIRAFDEAFPKTGFTDLKKVDFVLWQDVGEEEQE
ncbi:hypothetical protein C804_04937 [Lachnospiraceae bacterium A4]|jgi:hypothetical protein|nr:hypothetical protein C804_04937 [Lachnospiraceae bacterium A4]